VVTMTIFAMPNAYASDETEQRDGIDINKWQRTCYEGGVRDGKNGPFENEAYKECGDYGNGAERYYEGFIDGCEDAGNTKDVCESATD
jgi:hypothetical protein